MVDLSLFVVPILIEKNLLISLQQMLTLTLQKYDSYMILELIQLLFAKSKRRQRSRKSKVDLVFSLANRNQSMAMQSLSMGPEGMRGYYSCFPLLAGQQKVQENFLYAKTHGK